MRQDREAGDQAGHNIIKIATAFLANCQFQLDLTDQIKPTRLYSQRYRNILNQLIDMNEKYVSQILTKDMEESGEMAFYSYIKPIEKFFNAIQRIPLRQQSLEKFAEYIDNYEEEVLPGETTGMHVQREEVQGSEGRSNRKSKKK